MSEQEKPDTQESAPSSGWRAYTSPPIEPHASRRLSRLLFDWETRHLSPIRRHLTGVARRARRPAFAAFVGALLIVLGAAMVANPELEQSRIALLDRLRQTENVLKAREGELQLARLELQRLNTIVQFSREHRIPADLSTAIYDIAIAEGIEPPLAFSLVSVESNFTRRAVSSAGAVGFTQVMPSTAFWLQPGLSHADLFERDTNLRLGFRYLRMLLEQYDGDLHLALLAYNRGPGRVDNILRAGGDPNNGYSAAVRLRAQRLGGE